MCGRSKREKGNWLERKTTGEEGKNHSDNIVIDGEKKSTSGHSRVNLCV